MYTFFREIFFFYCLFGFYFNCCFIALAAKFYYPSINHVANSKTACVQESITKLRSWELTHTRFGNFSLNFYLKKIITLKFIFKRVFNEIFEVFSVVGVYFFFLQSHVLGLFSH